MLAFCRLALGTRYLRGFQGADLWGVRFCPAHFKLRFVAAFGIFGGAGHFVACPMAQAIYGVLLSFVSGFPGSFAQFLMLLMVRVAQGILRFILETFQSFRHIKSNRSFQGTPLRSAPELGR